MSNHKKPLLVSAMVAVLCMTIMSSIVYATQTESTTVNAGEQKILTFNLSEGDKFSGALSISGGSGNDVDFWVTDPNGNTIVNSGRVSSGRTFDFTCTKNGAYALHFDNSFSIFSSKFVSLSYDVERQIIPSLTTNSVIWIVLVVVIIGVLALIGLGIYLSLRRNRNKPPNPPPP